MTSIDPYANVPTAAVYDAFAQTERLPVDWLQEHLAAEATHYLFPTLVQRLRHRPEVPLQWRC
ncbi:hypothetical protein AB0K74_48435, partial [Streptomyces sp. NPDC056159]